MRTSFICTLCAVVLLTISACSVSQSLTQSDFDDALAEFDLVFMKYKGIEAEIETVYEMDTIWATRLSLWNEIKSRLVEVERVFSRFEVFEPHLDSGSDGEIFMRAMKKWIPMQREAHDLLDQCVSVQEMNLECVMKVNDANSRRWAQNVEEVDRLWAKLS